MTVGVLTTSFPRHRGDYAGGFVEDAVRALATGGDPVEVIAAGAQTGAALSDETRPDLGPQIRVIRIAPPASPQGGSLFYGAGAPEILERGGPAAWMQALAYWTGLCEQVRARAARWERIIAHWLVPSGLAARAVAPRLPLVAHAHSGDVALLERLPGGAALARWLARDGAELVFASADLRDRFARLTGGIAVGRVEAAGPPIGAEVPVRDAAARDEARRALRLDHRTVLSVGRLVPIKGFDVLLRAAARAAARDRAAGNGNERSGSGELRATKFVILGDGPERARLESLAHRLKVDVRLPGFVSRDEVARWMMAADLYVQPSRRLATGRTEGLPVATLEALSVGVPVVASASGGLREMAGPLHRVRLVPPGDPVALAACL